MALHISPELERFAECEIASGRFESLDDIVRCGISSRNGQTDAAVQQRHQDATAWAIDFMKNRASRLEGITLRELIDQGRRM